MFSILAAFLLAKLVHSFPFPSNSPSLLNVSTISAFHSPSRNASTALGDQVKNCFESQTSRVTPDSVDCDSAILQMGRDFTREMMRFSRQSNADFKLPRSYRYGSCVVYLDMVHDADEDIVSTSRIVTDALSLNRECVHDPDPWKYQLGGVISIWPKDLLYVVLFGRETGALAVS